MSKCVRRGHCYGSAAVTTFLGKATLAHHHTVFVNYKATMKKLGLDWRKHLPKVETVEYEVDPVLKLNTLGWYLEVDR